MTEPAKLELVQSNENYNVPGVVHLSSDKITTLGRSSRQCTVVLDATPTKSISRKHAEIVCTKAKGGGSTYILRDLGSTNGVFVNEVKIHEQTLKHGDVVQFGGAADIPVGTRFGGSGSHIRYRFDHPVSAPIAEEPRKRRQSSEPAPESPDAQRRRIEPPNELDAGEALRGAGERSLADTEEAGSGGAPRMGVGVGVGIGVGKDESVEKSGRKEACGDSAADDGQGQTPTMVMEVLRDAMCGLCSELLLDAVVLPCSHSFCQLCWADHAEERGTTCPVCMRKMHSSERNPRRCSNLDLLITSIVHKLAGPREREHWNSRVHRAETRAAAQARRVMSNSSSGRKAVPAPPKTEIRHHAAAGRSLAPAHGARSSEDVKSGPSCRVPIRGGGRGKLDPRSLTSRYSGMNGKGGGGESDSAAVESALVKTCEGCNEEGHEFRECPHRSDSALEGSKDDDDEGSDEGSDEGEEEEYSDDA